MCWIRRRLVGFELRATSRELSAYPYIRFGRINRRERGDRRVPIQPPPVVFVRAHANTKEMGEDGGSADSACSAVACGVELLCTAVGSQLVARSP